MGRGGKLAIAGMVAVVGLLGGGYALLSATGSDAPAPATLETPSATTTVAAGATQPGAARSGAAAPDGTWRVRAGAASFVGYRVREQLSFLSAPSEAVGRTTAVSGTLRIAANQVEAAEIQADLRQLASDQSRRDNAIRDRGLESDRFPMAIFELGSPIALPAAPVQGREVTIEGRGRLTVHGVTREVTLPLRGRWDGDAIRMAGRLPLHLSDYAIEPPRFGPVVSIEDNATIELQLVFEHA
jgi:polyisoprenoid-binding protein YceI